MKPPSITPSRNGVRTKNSDHPSGDDRFKSLDTSMKKLRYQPDSLIEVLHSAQGLFGCLNNDLLLYVAHALKLPPSRVYGVATFYHFFTLEPRGRHTCTICMGTACYVKGAGALLAAVEQESGLKDGMSAEDGSLSLTTARCLGSCGLAPAVVYDGEVAGHQGPEDVLNKLKEWEADHGEE